MEDDQNNYRLIGGDETKNNDEPSDKETTYLLNDGSTQNSTNNNEVRHSRNNINKQSISDLINNILKSFDTNNNISKFIIGALLFHPIINLIIQDNPTIKKMFKKSQRKLIKRILIVFMIFCLIGFSMSNISGENAFLSFILKFLLIVFILIHTNIFNITNFDATIKFWKKILNKKDK